MQRSILSQEVSVIKRFYVAGLLGIFLIGCVLMAQMTPWKIWTLLPDDQMDEIAGEASGETAWNTILETGGYNKDRPAEEYSGTFYEAQYIYDQLKKYGLPGARIVRFPGGKTWDGIKGELWEIEPKRQKLASYQDLRAVLASGSTTTDVKAQLVWAGEQRMRLSGRALRGKSLSPREE
jgi:hypothetical protein